MQFKKRLQMIRIIFGFTMIERKLVILHLNCQFGYLLDPPPFEKISESPGPGQERQAFTSSPC